MPFHCPETAVGSPGTGRMRGAGRPSGVCAMALTRSARWSALGLLILLSVAAALPAEAKSKVRLGAVENVVLLPWGVLMPARIDTGAATSSLDARNLTVKGNMAEFNLPPEYGGRRVKLPILKWKTVKTSEAEDRRPVVVVEFCIGSQRIRTRVNLNDRSTVRYPVLIGRNTLSRGFVVECGTSYCTQPSCPEVKTK